MALTHHREGEGAPLLLVHGAGHHWQGWAPVLRLLRARFDVIAADAPGFGRSTPLPAGDDHSVIGYAAAFEAFLDELGVRRAHLAGNSMGGAIALELARRGRALSVCAISPIGFWSPAERRYCQVSLRAAGALPRPARSVVRAAVGSAAGRTATLWQYFGRPWRMPAVVAREALEAFWAAPALRPAVDAFDRYDFRDGEALRHVPVTIAWGTRDLLLPARTQARRARQALPFARHAALRGLGHTPFYDDPVRVASVIDGGEQGG